MSKSTHTPTGQNFFVYKAAPLRTYLVGTFENNTKALAYAKDCSIGDSVNVFSVVNANAVCVGKYRNSKYYI